MSVARQYAAAIMLSPDEWWISGGYHNGDDIVNHATKSSEVFSAKTKAFRPFIKLPKDMAFHHMLALNSTHFVLVSTFKM